MTNPEQIEFQNKYVAKIIWNEYPQWNKNKLKYVYQLQFKFIPTRKSL